MLLMLLLGFCDICSIDSGRHPRAATYKPFVAKVFVDLKGNKKKNSLLIIFSIYLIKLFLLKLLYEQKFGSDVSPRFVLFIVICRYIIMKKYYID